MKVTQWKWSCCSRKVLGYYKSFFTAAAEKPVSPHAGAQRMHIRHCPGTRGAIPWSQEKLIIQDLLTPLWEVTGQEYPGQKAMSVDFVNIILQCPDSKDCGPPHDFRYYQRNTSHQQLSLSTSYIWFLPVALFYLLYLLCSLFTVFSKLVRCCLDKLWEK